MNEKTTEHSITFLQLLNRLHDTQLSPGKYSVPKFIRYWGRTYKWTKLYDVNAYMSVDGSQSDLLDDIWQNLGTFGIEDLYTSTIITLLPDYDIPVISANDYKFLMGIIYSRQLTDFSDAKIMKTENRDGGVTISILPKIAKSPWRYFGHAILLSAMKPNVEYNLSEILEAYRNAQ